MKTCRRCGEMVPLEGFAPSKANTDGRVSWCRQCLNAYKRNRYRADRENGIPIDPEREYRVRYSIMGSRARSRNLPFTLTYEDFRTFVGLPCHYCGGSVPVIGVDRLDNDDGYTPENTVPACPACNTWKSIMSLGEFAVHIERLYRRFVLGKRTLTDAEYDAPRLQTRWWGTGPRRPFKQRRRSAA